jgi:DNA-binding ferritin-like protein (Dps family)
MGDRYWKYWHQVIPDSSESGLRECEIITARDFIEQISSNGRLDLDPRAINLRLLNLITGDFNHPAAQCLRCYISHEIRATCEDLAGKHGKMGNFKNKDIFPYALEDYIEERREVLSEKLSKRLAIKILSTFNPSSGTELSTWTDRLVRTRREVVRFLDDHGVSRWTDWGLLNDATARDLENATTFLQVGLEEAKRLLTCFHDVYTEDRRRNAKKGKCEPPTLEQLQEICNLLSHSSSESLQLTDESLQLKLKLIAKGLRNWKMGGTRVTSEEAYELRKSRMDGMMATGEQAEVVDEFEQPEVSSADEDRDVFLAENEDFRDISRSEIKQMITAEVDRKYKQHQRRIDGKPAEYLQALHLYFVIGTKSQKEIAVELRWERQDQVSKLLRLADIDNAVFNGLQSKNIISSDINKNDNEFKRIMKLIRKYLNKEIIVDDQSQTVLSQAICKYLQSRGQG